MARRYPPEFRRRVLDLIASVRRHAEVMSDLGVNGQAIYNWQAQDLVDRGEWPGPQKRRADGGQRRIYELEEERAATKRASELLKVAVPQKGRYDASFFKRGDSTWPNE